MIQLNINADFLAQADVQTPATATGVWGDATGVANFVWRIAATKNGVALGSLSATAAARASKLNRYYTVFDTADLISALTAYAWRTVYVVLSRSGDLDGLWWRARVVDNQSGG